MTEPISYPITANLELVNEADINAYLGMLFDGVEFAPDQWVCARGIGEKGTPREGEFRDDTFIQPTIEDLPARILGCAQRWAQYHAAAFIVPCVLRAAKGSADNVALFTTILVDLDSGDTTAKLDHLREHLGEPTMTVLSGGMTDSGQDKLHVYYRLQQPSDDVRLIVTLRDMIAHKAGGDPQFGLGVESNPFGRAHQPVRIPGTCHAKHGIAKTCRISVYSERVAYDLSLFQHWVEQMPVGPWSKPRIEAASQLGLFHPWSGDCCQHDVGSALNHDVFEGGTDVTRWSSFNQVAGHYLHMARRGDMTEDEARTATLGWVEAKMVPPWPKHRAETEFQAILNKELRGNGPMPKPPQPLVQNEHLGLRVWSAHRWITEPKPEHTFLVEGLVVKGEPHLMVSEGGAGKSMMSLDLGMKIAAFQPGDDLEWCGQPIKNGGAVVLIYCEDSKTETHIRAIEVDGDRGLIKKAGDKLMVLPMVSVGGAFSLVERDGKAGSTKSSKRWNEMIGLMHDAQAHVGGVALVVVDTLNAVSHGDENSSVVIAELMREAHRVCAELGAALFILHHVRKSDEAPRSLEDLRNAIRGSTAIPSYFRICMGMFMATDYDRRMKAMGMPSVRGGIWRFGITKCNIHGLLRGEKTLWRSPIGLLHDVTNHDRYNHVNICEREAWLVLAVKLAARAGHPYSNQSKNASAGFYKRRNELPPLLKSVGAGEFASLVEESLQKSHVQACAVRGSKDKKYLDIPNGPLASDEAGAEISAGAYSPLPNWDLYEFSKEDGGIVAKSDSAKPVFRPGA